jgi:hypothetical protein
LAGGHHPTYMRRFGEALRASCDVVLEASDETIASLRYLSLFVVPLGAGRPLKDTPEWVELRGVERAEAEAILDGDRETAVALLTRLGELVEANQRLEARVAELERRLNRSSRNSSLPPSQDPPSAPPRPKKPASGPRPGGQPGHEGSCFRPSGWTRSSTTGRSGVARASTSSAIRSALMLVGHRGTRSPSCRRPRCA